MKIDSAVPETPLPLPPGFTDVEAYISSLLTFSTTSQLLHTLCGGVHILDFLTRTPDLYSTLIPGAWRQWFVKVDIQDVLDLLLREDLDKIRHAGNTTLTWRDHPLPPQSLITYISDVRNHLLAREFVSAPPRQGEETTSKKIFTGMSLKKIHEVGNFAKYVDQLASQIETTEGRTITHLADFGAGQNYLGRVLASKPYNRDIIAIESRPHVVDGAKNLDIYAKLTQKPLVMRNKKAYKAANSVKSTKAKNLRLTRKEDSQTQSEEDEAARQMPLLQSDGVNGVDSDEAKMERWEAFARGKFEANMETSTDGRGTVQYIEHRIKDGNLSSVIENIIPQSRIHPQTQQSTPALSTNAHEISAPSTPPSAWGTVQTANSSQQDPSVMVISLHSCGNLVHHGLRTLTLNPAVKAVAMIGCCYNLMTERLGPPTHKMHLRPAHPRLDATGGARDPHGFPMSERFANYRHSKVQPPDFSRDSMTSDEAVDRPDLGAQDESGLDSSDQEQGIRMNITARMMAVQAPENWTQAESSSFFTRHFFRAVLQRIFLDKGVVSAPPTSDVNNEGCSPAGTSWGMAGEDGGRTSPVVIGNLSKKCYKTFTSYVRGAVDKLSVAGGQVAETVRERVGSMSDDEILEYELRYAARKQELSIVWSLMAFSAGVVEALVVVDRWLWLQEQDCVRHAWVEPVFSYALSPRNLVVVGLK